MSCTLPSLFPTFRPAVAPLAHARETPDRLGLPRLLRPPLLAALTAGALCALLPAPALASTLPGADQRATLLGGGVGYGAGLSVDGDIGSATRLGVSLGLARYFVTPSFDIRLAHRIPTESARFNLSLIAGAFGQGLPFPLGVEAGAGLAYDFTSRLAGRLNLVFGFVPFQPYERDFVLGLFSAPAAGFELGYQFTNELEGTLGVSGRGEVLGLTIRL